MSLVQVEQVELGAEGAVYDGAVTMSRDGSGNLVLKDQSFPSGTTLSELRDSVPSHSITDHDDLGSDFATQYYNLDRLSAYLSDSGNPPVISTVSDVLGNTTLAAHVSDSRLHQQVPKFVLRVAQQGAEFSSIAEALAAIPTDGPDAPGPDQWWLIEVSPGVYESVNLNRSYVMVVGQDPSTTIISGTTAGLSDPPVRVGASNCILRGFTIRNTSNETEGTTPAVRVGSSVGPPVGGVELRDCVLSGPVYGVLLIMNGSGSTVRSCKVSSVWSDPVEVSGSSRFEDCTFETVNAGANCLSGTVEFFRCRQIGGTVAFQVRNAELKVTDYSCDETVSLYSEVDGNTESVITVSRVGGVVPPESTPRVTVMVSPEIGLVTAGDVLVDWTTIRRGRYGYGAAGKAAETGAPATGTDHLFVRNINHESPSSGDVVEIADLCSVGTTNALKLKLKGSSGRFLRWVSESGGIETELGYIARDGSVYAPKFVGSCQSNPSTTATTDFAGSVFGSTAAHTAGNMALLRSVRVLAPDRTKAGTVTDAIALDVEAVTGVGTGRNLSAFFRGDVEVGGVANFAGATSAANAVRVGGVACLYMNGTELNIARFNTRFSGSGRSLIVTTDSTGARLTAFVNAGQALEFVTANNNADITMAPHGVGKIRCTGGAAFQVPHVEEDPASPGNGDLWYNVTSHELKAYVGGSTVVLA